jgi:hypothetical protein
MGSSKLNTISDPLSQQKTQAANIGLGNYQQASANVPALQGVANNLNQSTGQTLANQSPLFQSLYNDVSQDVSGSGGPFSALTQNLLGSFDTQQNNTQQQLQQQLQAQGLLGSGAGMAVLGNQGVNAAQARAGLVDQNQVNMLNYANQIAQFLAQQNQQQGFNNPMAALGEIQSLATPPNFQDVNNSYYTPAPTSQGFQQALGDVLATGNTVASLMSGMPSSTPGLGTTGTSPNYYTTNNGMGFPYTNPAIPYLNQPLTFSQ